MAMELERRYGANTEHAPSLQPEHVRARKLLTRTTEKLRSALQKSKEAKRVAHEELQKRESAAAEDGQIGPSGTTLYFA